MFTLWVRHMAGELGRCCGQNSCHQHSCRVLEPHNFLSDTSHLFSRQVNHPWKENRDKIVSQEFCAEWVSAVSYFGSQLQARFDKRKRDISLDSQTKVLVVRGEGGSVFKKREEGRWILNCRPGAWDACQPVMKEMVPNNREQPRRNVNVSRIFMLLRNLFIII